MGTRAANQNAMPAMAEESDLARTQQIMGVVVGVARMQPTTLEELTKSRIRAIREVAQATPKPDGAVDAAGRRKPISTNAVFDKCTRQLGVNANEFDQQLWKLFEKGFPPPTARVSSFRTWLNNRALSPNGLASLIQAFNAAASQNFNVGAIPAVTVARPPDPLVQTGLGLPRILQMTSNVVLEGVPGTGKTHAITHLSGKTDSQGKPIPDSGIKAMHTPTGRRLTTIGTSPFVNVEVRFMTMHPSTSYEDFVEGLRPVGSSRAGFARWGAPDLFGEAHPLKLGTAASAPQPPIFVRFKDREDLVKAKVTIEDSGWFLQAKKPTSGDFAVQDGFFVLACREAAVDPNKAIVVVLDELNRCNIPKVLGDLMTVIEESKRAHWDGTAWVVDSAAKAVTLPYSGRKLFVPDNLFIVGTMNTTDRSVAPMDAALRRRFAFHRVWPQGFGPDAATTGPDLEKRLSDAPAIKSSLELWQAINRLLLAKYGADAMLGHSYLDDLRDALSRKGVIAAEVVAYHWNHRILPQLMDVIASNGLTRSFVVNPRKFFGEDNAPDLTKAGTVGVFKDQLVVTVSGEGSLRSAEIRWPAAT